MRSMNTTWSLHQRHRPCRTSLVSFLFITQLLCCRPYIRVADAIDTPGVRMEPFPLGAPQVALDTATLASGRPYFTNWNGDIPMVVQDVELPLAMVWERILNFDDYPRRIPEIQTCTATVLKKKKSFHVYLERKFPYWPFGKTIQLELNYAYSPRHNTLTWTTPDRAVTPSVGYWYVFPSADNKSRVYHSIQIHRLPPFIHKAILAQDIQGITTMGLSERSSVPPAPIGLKRYALVCTVLILLIYNIYLYLSV